MVFLLAVETETENTMGHTPKCGPYHFNPTGSITSSWVDLFIPVRFHVQSSIVVNFLGKKKKKKTLLKMSDFTYNWYLLILGLSFIDASSMVFLIGSNTNIWVFNSRRLTLHDRIRFFHCVIKWWSKIDLGINFLFYLESFFFIAPVLLVIILESMHRRFKRTKLTEYGKEKGTTTPRLFGVRRRSRKVGNISIKKQYKW